MDKKHISEIKDKSAASLATANLIDDWYHNNIRVAATEKAKINPTAIYGGQYASGNVFWLPPKMGNKKDEIIAAIRTDKKVGVGSCSTVDEAMTDDELWEALVSFDAASTIKSAIAFAHKLHDDFTSIYEDTRGIFADPPYS